MKQNLKLLVAIREQNLRQVQFAKIVGDHHTYLSGVINGRINLDQGRKSKYARALNKRVDELFDK